MIGKVEPTHGLSLAETISLRYALDEEMTLTPVDYLLRRTNHLLSMIHIWKLPWQKTNSFPQLFHAVVR
ncbi:hypothetical protein WP50_11745 [Lactiplantibacillus plantarum]|nr:hypothetical protein WP50_11745 [Lactiplantibacillus plantarum]